jgi:hypothetical protein
VGKLLDRNLVGRRESQNRRQRELEVFNGDRSIELGNQAVMKRISPWAHKWSQVT